MTTPQPTPQPTSGSSEFDQPLGFVQKFGPTTDDVPLGTGVDPSFSLGRRASEPDFTPPISSSDPRDDGEALSYTDISERQVAAGEPDVVIGPDPTPPVPVVRPEPSSG